MAEDKKSFLLYTDLIHTVNKMPSEKAGELFKHILSYVNDLNPETDDLIIQLTFEPIKQQLKRDLLKYKESIIDKSNAGKLGNLKRWNKDLYDQVMNNKLDLNDAYNIAESRRKSHSDNMQSQPIAEIAVNDNVNVNVKEIYSFDEFWSTYDKSVDKQKCKTKFEKLSHEVKLKIKEVLPLYIQSTPDKQFRKNPQTWLNGQCWNDEVKTIIKEETVEQMNDRMLYENVMKKINMYHAKD